jgi:hypothetical protein
MGSIWNVVDGLTGLFITIYFGYIDKHYFWISMVGFWFSFICVIGVISFVTESPVWLLRTGDYEKAKQIILRIVRFNGIQVSE